MTEAVGAFSTIERTIFFVFVGLFLISTVSLLWKVDHAFLVTVPRRGGTLQEGIIGSPRFINPLLAISDADKDLSALVYSGLLKLTPDGKLVPDLAATYTISPDGLVYTFNLKDNIYFQDGKPVSADDIVFTISKAQDPSLKSPKLVNWAGVTVTEPNPKQVIFTLKHPYSPFLENTTLGILPKHIWQNISADEFPFSTYNSEPIGSGAYKLKGLKRDAGGIPTYYRFTPYNKYAGSEPYISNLIVKFYRNEDDLVSAYRNGDIESVHGIAPENVPALGTKANIQTADLPRIFGIFFNQSQSSIFTDKIVRIALDRALDKKEIVKTVLKGFGTPIDGPIPPGLNAGSTTDALPATTTDPATLISDARQMLLNDGWKAGSDGILVKDGTSPLRLAFSISTSDTPELTAAANAVAEQWRKIGADVSVHIFQLGDLNQNVIRARKYDALLFGQAVGPDLDFYPFWHSSQRNDPGLNVAEYANVKVDKLLEEARITTDESTRISDIESFDAAIKQDMPAIFLYSPKFIYVLPDSVKGSSFGEIITPADRFNTIPNWYIETHKVWSIFASQNSK